ncbi:hypothetical protein C1I97_25495, partial [Streptomyces sp. NTH33]
PPGGTDQLDGILLELGRVPLARVALLTHYLDCFLRDPYVPVSSCPDHGGSFTGQFLQGAAYKLGSGAVTLLILWWETRH